MSFYYSDNPLVDFDRWDAEQGRRLARLPVCCHCHEPIQQEDAIVIDGRWFCDYCIENDFRQSIEDYLEDC